MATSAIGPGFLTQTTVFTQQMGYAFGFVILASILIDIVVQLCIWLSLGMNRSNATTLSNNILPGSGYVLTLLISFGGFAFNIGNIAGAALGLQVLTGLAIVPCALIAILLSASVFWFKQAHVAIDKLVVLLGGGMILLLAYIVFKAHPPMHPVLVSMIFPNTIEATPILTLVGGTVGGYISFAGIHRLLEQPDNLSTKIIQKSAITGIGITGLLRMLMFLGVLGILLQGKILSTNNPMADVFLHAAGDLGYYFFGMLLFAAAITSVVGCTYTTISFTTGLYPSLQQYKGVASMGFIGVCGMVFIAIGKPIKLLVWAGALNGMVLPFALFIFLWGSFQKKKSIGYKLPSILRWMGLLIGLALLFLSYQGIKNLMQ